MIVMNNILFSHAPVNNIPEFVDFNVHGHLHAGVHRDIGFELTTRHILVSLEKTGYKLLEYNELITELCDEYTKKNTIT